MLQPGMQVLNAALKPRALWVAAHHLELSGRMDGLWSALLNAVADLVSGNEAEVDARRCDNALLDMLMQSSPPEKVVDFQSLICL